MPKTLAERQAAWYAKQKSPHGVIYKITHVPSGSFYIGSTKNSIKKRFWQHRANSKDTNQQDRDLYSHMSRHDLDDYVIEEVYRLEEDDILIDVEHDIIQKLQPDLNTRYDQ